MTQIQFDLEDRLLEYAARIIRLCEKLPTKRSGNHVGGQLRRSGTSPLPNHGGAQAAESRDEFIHKMSVCLKKIAGIAAMDSVDSTRAFGGIAATP
jgi:four helix bundle protein